ncbi:hypothetical protein RB195_017022 [Necator americanus]|uniref:Uncharacterized protein n=1 Tax=Necator americanus TaxID=51031 RepID=A0ABR1C5E3_NECAM
MIHPQAALYHECCSEELCMTAKKPKIDESELDDSVNSFERIPVESDEDVMGTTENDSIFDDVLMLLADKESDSRSNETLSMSDSATEQMNVQATQKLKMTVTYISNFVHMISHVVVANQSTFTSYN